MKNLGKLSLLTLIACLTACDGRTLNTIPLKERFTSDKYTQEIVRTLDNQNRLVEECEYYQFDTDDNDSYIKKTYTYVDGTDKLLTYAEGYVGYADGIYIPRYVYNYTYTDDSSRMDCYLYKDPELCILSEYEIYKYDDNNNVIEFERGGPLETGDLFATDKTVYTYDSFDRLVKEVRTSISIAFGTISRREKIYEYNSKNQLVHMNDSQYDVSYTYDEQGRLIDEYSCFAGSKEMFYHSTWDFTDDRNYTMVKRYYSNSRIASSTTTYVYDYKKREEIITTKEIVGIAVIGINQVTKNKYDINDRLIESSCYNIVDTFESWVYTTTYEY